MTFIPASTLTQSVLAYPLLSDNLHKHLFAATSVEFTAENLLPRAKIHSSLGYGNYHFAPHDLALHVCVRIVFAGIVVAILSNELMIRSNMPQVQLHNPYLSDGYTWLKGNLHTHTTFSDGVRPPEEVIADYERRGYDFLGISDHDTFVPPDAYQHLTRMVLVPAVEVTALGPHIQHVGVRQRVEPDTNRQNVIDGINADGGLAVMNHPNWEWHFNHLPQEQMEDLQGAIGLEVYNGVIEHLDGAALASDRWDRLLSIGRQLWGFANDDSHEARDVGVAWNVVQARTRSVSDILRSLREGQFYASTGVIVNDVSVDGFCIRVSTENAQRIRFVTRFGTIRATIDDATAEWQLPENPAQLSHWRYVRVECYGAGGRMAWTQPIQIEVH